MSIEELTIKLVALANKSTLSQAEYQEARKLMTSLKAAGLSNEEISQISKGRWSPSTVKGYTKGIKANTPSPWQDTVSLLNDLISTGIGLEDVDTVVTVVEDLKSRGVSLDNIIDLLLTADSASIDLATLVQQSKELGESGLSPKSVAEAIGLKKDLEAKGLSLDCLPMLVKLAQNYGDPQEVLEALSAYGSLGEVEDEISTTKKELENLSAQRASVHQKLEQTQATLSELTKPLQAYHNVLELGFGEKQLVIWLAWLRSTVAPKLFFRP